jgi:hypothetical protein
VSTNQRESLGEATLTGTKFQGQRVKHSAGRPIRNPVIVASEVSTSAR